MATMFTLFCVAVLQLLLLTSPILSESSEGDHVDPGPVLLPSFPVLLPSFTWITSRTLEMTFPDGGRDKTFLRPADKVGDLDVPCLYEGVLEREPSAFLAVSGCHDDQVVDVVVYTERLPARSMYRIVNGTTEAAEMIAVNKKVEEPRRKIKRLRKRGIYVGDDDYVEYGDYDDYDDYADYDDYDEVANEGGQAVKPFYVLNVRLAFEENFLELAGNETHARHKIARIFTLGKQHLKHPSLGTSIRLRPIGPITKVPNKKWKPGQGSPDNDLIDSRSVKKNDKIPITFFCGSDKRLGEDRVRASSYPRKACHEEKGVALMEYEDDNQLSAQTYAHETSHWIGIQHDKDEDRKGSKCEGTGLMSHVLTPNRPEQWSTCSKERLEKWLNNPSQDHSCLKEDIELYQLDKASFAFDCFKWKTHLRSGCDRPGEMLHGEWLCADDGVMCFPACKLGYKISHPSGKTNTRCFKEKWRNNPEEFSCVIDKAFDIPSGSLSCTGDTCNLICDFGYDSTALRTPGNPLTPVTCDDNTWRKHPSIEIDPSQIACDRQCELPDVFPDVGTWEDDGECSFRVDCPSGYKPANTYKTTFQVDKDSWTFGLDSFSCLPCQKPNILPAGGQKWELQEKCSYRLVCQNGYKSKDARTTKLENDNTWEIPLDSFECIESVWGPWSCWSSCSQTCGGGSQTRNRTCSSEGNCQGSSTDSRTCSTNSCSVWEKWSSWTSCSQTCGGGSQTRSRTCTSGGNCQGSSTHSRMCGTDSCPVWRQWGSWTSCSQTCGGGSQTRSRTCTSEGNCKGSSTVKRTCSTGSCPIGPVYFIAGGDDTSRDISVYHPTVDNVACSILPPTLNIDWWDHSTFYHDNTVHLCGGLYTASTCISHKKNTAGWKTHTLTTSRWYGHSSVVLRGRVYFIGGGDSQAWDGNYVGASSTPLPLTDTPVLTPQHNLDYKGFAPCTARIDQDTLVVTGGSQGWSSYLTTVATYNVRTRKYTQLPSLKQPRTKHGCGVLERGDNKWIIVAGGRGDGEVALQSTEMLQLGGRQWTTIGNLIVARYAHSMAVTQRGVMVMGGYGVNNKLSSVELLDWDSAGKTWSVVQPSLKKPRSYFGGAVEIPASMFGCTG